MIAPSRLARSAFGVALALGLLTCSEATGPGSPVYSISLDVHSVALSTGDSVRLFGTTRDAQGVELVGQPIQWTVRDPVVARVDTSGWIVALYHGRSVVDARSGRGQDSATLVTFFPRVTRVTPAVDTLTYVGSVVDLQATASDGLGVVSGQFVWVSRGPAVVEVSQTGRVTARGDGSAYVVAFEALGSRDSALAVVHRKVASIALTPRQASLPLRRQQAFSATALDFDAFPVPGVRFAWSSSDSAVATVDSSGHALAVAVGVDTIRALANGVTGTATFTTRPLPALRFNLDTIYSGVGVFLSDTPHPFPGLIPDSADAGQPFTAKLTISDTSLARIPDTVSVPNEYYASIEWDSLVGKRPGRGQLTASEPRYTPARAVLVVSTPRLKAGLYRTPATLGVNQQAQFFVSFADSFGNYARAAHPTVIHLRSSDSTVLRVDADSVAAATRDFGAVATATPKGIGRASIQLSAIGFLPDTLQFTIVPAHLHFVAPDLTPVSRATLAVGEYDAPGYVWSGDAYLRDSIVVTLTQRHPERVRIPPSVRIPGNSYPSTQLLWTGLAQGVDTLIASAPGYLSDTMILLVTTPTFAVPPFATSGQVTGALYGSAFVGDSFGVGHYPALGDVTAYITSSDTTVLRPVADSTTVGNTTLGGGFGAYLVGPGSASLTLSAPRSQFVPKVVGPITVGTTRLVMTRAYNLPPGPITLGLRQQLGVGLLGAVVPEYGGGLVSFHFRSSNPRAVTPAMTDAGPVLGGGVAVDLLGGDSTGVAWIVASGRGLTADSVPVSVGRPYLVFPAASGGWEGDSAFVEIQIRDQAGNLRFAAEPVPLAITSSDEAVVSPDTGALVIPASGYNAFAKVRFRSPGTATLVAADPRSVPQHYEPGASGLITVLPRP